MQDPVHRFAPTRRALRRPLLVGAVVVSSAALLSTPALAHGHGHHARHHYGPLHGVRHHARKARVDLHRVQRGRHPGIQLHRMQAQTVRAGRRTARLVNSAETSSERLRAAKGAALIARLTNGQVVGLTGALDGTSGRMQSALGDAIKGSLIGREIAVQVLQSLIDVVPQEARPALEKVIASLSSREPGQTVDLGSSIQNGTVSKGATDAVGQAFALAIQATQSALDRIGPLLDVVPQPVRGAVQDLLKQIPAELAQIQELVQAIVADVPGATSGSGNGSSPGAGSNPGSGSHPGSGSSSGGLFGIGGIINSVTHLVDSLLSHLPFIGGLSGGGLPGFGSLFSMFSGLFGV